METFASLAGKVALVTGGAGGIGAAGNGGSIINLSSIAGLRGVPGHSAYGSSKGAVRSYSRHAAVADVARMTAT